MCDQIETVPPERYRQSAGGKRQLAGLGRRWSHVRSETAELRPESEQEGIPARAWQEGAGQATGLVVGLLGTGHVVVPEEFAEKAREILDEDDDFIDELNEE